MTPTSYTMSFLCSCFTIFFILISRFHTFSINFKLLKIHNFLQQFSRGVATAVRHHSHTRMAGDMQNLSLLSCCLAESARKKLNPPLLF